MPVTVEVPGVGVVEFPDGMSEQAMGSAIRKGFPGAIRKQLEVDREDAERERESFSVIKTAAQLQEGFKTGVAAGMPEQIAGAAGILATLRSMPKQGSQWDYPTADTTRPKQAQSLRRFSDDIIAGAGEIRQERARESESIGGGPVGRFAYGLGDTATSVLPAIPATMIGGLPGAMLVGAGQSAGATYTQATRAGYSPEQATGVALPAGLITGSVTGLFGKTGLEKWLTDRVLPKGAWRGLAEVAKQFGLEAAEEGTDEALQAALAKVTFEPDMTAQEAGLQVLTATLAGGLLTLPAAGIRVGVAAAEQAAGLQPKRGPEGQQPPPRATGTPGPEQPGDTRADAGDRPPVLMRQADPAPAEEVMRLIGDATTEQQLADLAQMSSVRRGFQEQWSAAEQEAVTMALLQRRNELALAQSPHPETDTAPGAERERPALPAPATAPPALPAPADEAAGTPAEAPTAEAEGSQLSADDPSPAAVESPSPTVLAPDETGQADRPPAGEPVFPESSAGPSESRRTPVPEQSSAVDAGAQAQSTTTAPADKPEAAPRFRRGQRVFVRKRANLNRLHRAKVVRVEDDEVLIQFEKTGLFQTLPMSQVEEPRSVSGRREYEQQFKGMTEAERKQSKRDARGFRDLVRNEGFAFGWYDPRHEATDTKEARIARDKALKDGLIQALQAVGVPPEDAHPQDARLLAKMLPNLRQWIQQNAEPARQRMEFEEATREGEQPVPVKDLLVGDELDIEGQRTVVTSIDANGAVELEDGTRFGTQIVDADQTIYVEDWLAGELEAAPDAFSLDAPESVDEQKARLAREARAEKERRDREAMLDQQAAPLTGTTGDLGQGDMLSGPEDLWAPRRPGSGSSHAHPASAYPGGPVGGGPAPAADNPAHSVFHAELPEAVNFIRKLLSGHYPRVKQRLRSLRGEALGVFRHRDAAGQAEIELRHDLFGLDEGVMAQLRDRAQKIAEATSDNKTAQQRIYRDKLDELVLEESKRTAPLMALKVIWHEIGHLVDWLPQHMIDGRGNLFGHIASLQNYLKHWLPMEPGGKGKPLAQSEKRKMRTEAKRQLERELGEIIETITVEEPVFEAAAVTPDMVRAMFGMDAREQYPDLYMWFAGQPAAVKKEIVRKAMKDIVDERVQQQAGRKRTGTRRIETQVRRPGRKPTEAEIARRFAKLLAEAMQARRLADLNSLKAELEPLIAWWRGTDTMEDYFKAPAEMFAEAFGVFMNNPAAVAKRAPTYYELMHHYLDSRPEVRAEYAAIQDAIRSGTVMRDRVQRLRETWSDDDEASVRLAHRRLKLRASHWLDNISYHLDRRFGPLYRLVKRSPLAPRVSRAVGDFLYRADEHELFLGRMNRTVSRPLVDANLDWNDLGEYMFHQHVVNSRFVRNEAGELRAIANPLGWTPKNSTERLGEMQAELGPQRWQALRAAHEQFRKLYVEHVVNPLRRAGMVSDELMQAITDRVFYATFAARKGEAAAGIEELLDAAHGRGVGARIYRQVGQLGEIKQPATATVLKALSLQSAIARNNMKQEAMAAILDLDPENVRVADRRWTGRRLEWVTKDTPHVGTVIVMFDGKPTAYYVPKMFADMLNDGNPTENVLAIMMLKANRGLKELFTQLNYAFWPVAAARDAAGWVMQLPKAGPVDLARELPRSVKAAYDSLKHRRKNALAEAALKRRMVISRADPQGLGSTVGNEYDAKLASFGLDPVAWDKETRAVKSWLPRFWNSYRELGQVFERSFKIAGMRYLDRVHPSMPEWQKRQIVRERAGSPDFLQRGTHNAWADLLLLFYNPWKEGMRSLYRSAKQNPASFTAKTVAFVAAPTAIMALGAAGGLGEELKRLYRSVPDYDLTNYLVVPLFWADKRQKKVAYLRLPLWEPARIMHGLLFKALTGRGEGYGSYLGGQVPSANPIFDVARAWMQYELAGNNPYDYFRGREIISNTAFEAGSSFARPELLRWTWNSLGGGILARLKSEQIDAPDPKEVESFLALPVISNALGRWLKVSNGGLHDLAQDIEEPIKQFRAASRAAVIEMIPKLRNGEALTDAEKQLLRDPYAFQYLIDRLERSEMNRADPLLRAMQGAQTAEGKRAILSAPEFAPVP